MKSNDVGMLELTPLVVFSAFMPGAGTQPQIISLIWTNDPNAPLGQNGTVVFEPTSITISAVPVPAALWFFGSGLLGLFGITKRKKA